MSGQSSQRVRRIASPSLKQGPMRATHHFGLRPGSSPTATTPRSSSGRKGSPCSSPTPWIGPPPDRKNPRSPDHRASPDNRTSPSSPFIKDKSRPPRHSPVQSIKRTSSLDTYLKGEWPRDTVVPFHTLAVPTTGNVPLTDEKATQTPEEFWDEPFERKKRGSHMRSASLGNNDTLKKETIKARLAKSKEGSRVTISGCQRNSPVQGNHAVISMATVSTTTVVAATHHSKAVAIPHIPKPTIHVRGSVEGLSQEIETVLRCTSGSYSEELVRTQDPTPDGHRAPIAELLTTRNVDTQTPHIDISLVVPEEEEPEEMLKEEDEEEEDEEEDRAGGRRSRSSVESSSSPLEGGSQSDSAASLPIIPGHMDSSRPSSLSEGLKDNTDCASPDLKSFSFAREPPDGCEKVKTVHEENLSGMQGPKPVSSANDSHFCPIKKPSEKYCIPSEVSAFCPLLKPYVLQSSEYALRVPPGGTTSHASQTIEGQ